MVRLTPFVEADIFLLCSDPDTYDDAIKAISELPDNYDVLSLKRNAEFLAAMCRNELQKRRIKKKGHMVRYAHTKPVYPLRYLVKCKCGKECVVSKASLNELFIPENTEWLNDLTLGWYCGKDDPELHAQLDYKFLEEEFDG